MIMTMTDFVRIWKQRSSWFPYIFFFVYERQRILQNYAVQHNVPFRGGRGVSREYTSRHVSINWPDAKLAWQFNYDKSTIECAVSWTQHAAVISLSVHPSLHPRLSHSPSPLSFSLNDLSLPLSRRGPPPPPVFHLCRPLFRRLFPSPAVFKWRISRTV